VSAAAGGHLIMAGEAPLVARLRRRWLRKPSNLRRFASSADHHLLLRIATCPPLQPGKRQRESPGFLPQYIRGGRFADCGFALARLLYWTPGSTGAGEAVTAAPR